MATRTELTDTLIALIPEDGSRISNAEIKAALEKEAGDSINEAELKELKSHVIAMEAAEAAKGPGGGLKAPGIDPPPRTGAAAKKNCRNYESLITNDNVLRINLYWHSRILQMSKKSLTSKEVAF